MARKCCLERPYHVFSPPAEDKTTAVGDNFLSSLSMKHLTAHSGPKVDFYRPLPEFLTSVHHN